MQNYKKSNEIKRIVIWGLRKKFHTHRYIHKAFYENAKKIGYDVVWVEDDKENQKYIKSGDLIISAEPVGKMVPEKFDISDYNLPIRNDVFYCLHKFKDIFLSELKKNVDRNRILELLVYENKAEKSDTKIRAAVFFDSVNRVLYQPWGTNLLPNEFKKPVFNKNRFVFWIGSVWNDKNNHGNVNEIMALKVALKKNNLKFVHLRFIPDWLNIILVRLSRIAPAIGGRIQTEVNYLPCRVFKNISYGQLAITNVKRFKDILGDYFIDGETIEDLVSKGLSLSENDYKNMVIGQQKSIINYTYEQAIKNIVQTFYL
jgi:hypothetical protein